MTFREVGPRPESIEMHGLTSAVREDLAPAKKKPKKKRVAENITEDYLLRRSAQQTRDIMKGRGDDVKIERQLGNTEDWLDRLVRKRLLTKDFR